MRSSRPINKPLQQWIKAMLFGLLSALSLRTRKYDEREDRAIYYVNLCMLSLYFLSQSPLLPPSP